MSHSGRLPPPPPPPPLPLAPSLLLQQQTLLVCVSRVAPRRNVVFTGSRGWCDERAVRDTLATLDPQRHTIVHGHCSRGLDPMVDRLARAAGFTVVRVPAEWRKYGARCAGPIRNRLMLDQYKPCLVYAYVCLQPDGKWTSGTADCVRRAHERGIRVIAHKLAVGVLSGQ